MSDGLLADEGTSRRSFLRNSVTVVSAMAASVAALSPLKDIDPDDIPSVEQLLQKHYKEMSPGEMATVLDRITHEVSRRYDVDAVVRDIRPKEGVEFVYALNLTRCVGCRKCVHACVEENNQSRSPEIQYIRVLEMPQAARSTRRRAITTTTGRQVPTTITSTCRCSATSARTRRA